MSDPILLTDRALIAVTGPDWRGFLQGLVSQDVETLRPGELRYGLLLSPQGRILFDLFLLGELDGCLIDCPANGREALIQRLTLYRLRSKVALNPEDRAVSAIFEGATPEAGWIADPRLPALGWRAYGRADPGEADLGQYDAHRLKLGVPGPADWGSDQLYALEADLDLLGAIDFHKGCFIGQEIASRMKRRGQIKSRTLPIVFDGPAPPHGTEIRSGEHRAGEVLSGRDGRALALIRLDRIADGDLSAAGRPVKIEQPGWLTL
jgi:tRNA-modifying protein YgfZ